jgi:uncharacterized protein YifE (UPF0438 family)
VFPITEVVTVSFYFPEAGFSQPRKRYWAKCACRYGADFFALGEGEEEPVGDFKRRILNVTRFQAAARAGNRIHRHWMRVWVTTVKKGARI